MDLIIMNCEEKVRDEIQHFIVINHMQIDEILIARDETEAEMMVKRHTPDIIIAETDSSSTLITEFSHCLSRFLNGTRFILINGKKNGMQHPAAPVDSNPAEYLVKPIDFNEFKETLQKTINIRRQEKWEERQRDTLQRKMDENLPMLRDIFFCDLMDGKDIGNLKERIEYLQIEIPKNKQYLSICINWNDKKDRAGDKGNLDAIIVMQMFRRVLEAYFTVYIVIREKTRIACILFIDQPGDELKSLLEKLFGDLCSDAKTRYGLDITVGVGIAVEVLDGVYSSYHQACDVLRRGRFSGGGPSFFFSDIFPEYNPTKIKSVALTSEAKAEIIDCIYCYDIGRIAELLHAELERVRSGRVMTENAVIALKIELASFLIEIADKILYDEEKNERDKKFLRELLAQESIIGIEEKMIEILTEMSNILGKNRRRHTSKIIEDVKEELRKNIQSGINVQTIAYSIGISPNYLSATFKAETGMRLTEYILSMRLEKAEGLLHGSSMKVGEIAEMVGCGDQTYFSKLFKKQFGLNPTEYRTKSREKDRPNGKRS